jgi:predicted nuclease of restriction endonuclease-like (RecB) superfamily
MPAKSNKEEFVDRANIVHDKRYSYDKVVYTRSKTNVIITCKKHGDFEQKPNSHLRGRGCSKCSGKQKLNTEEFVARSKVVHGEDQYSYDKVVYVGCYTNVVIICKKHGDFEQSPASHLQGAGCPKCAGNEKSNTEEFVARSNMTHGSGTYNYDKVVYVNSQTNVVITCLKHGDFKQRPRTHIQGRGCTKCGNDRKKSSTEEFVARSKVVHDSGTYNYDKVVYVSAHTKVTIICLKHGDFKQTPTEHLQGAGCPKCYKDRNKSNTEKFVAKSKVVHGTDQYNYDKVVYVHNKTMVVITCKKHGDFEQKPISHLQGNGCPRCHSSKGENTIRKWLAERGYQFQEQVRFTFCRDTRTLPFDFGVRVPNQMLIEFHGTQHYELYSFRSSGKDTQEQMAANLAKVQLHDVIKAKWCEDNNIPLLVIPYWDKHRIPELLEEFLGSAPLALV